MRSQILADAIAAKRLPSEPSLDTLNRIAGLVRVDRSEKKTARRRIPAVKEARAVAAADTSPTA